jgi:hypothetical protein
MPTIITQGAASAKALGFARASTGGGGTLQTVTFTSNSTWTAPTGVSLVTTASGYGAAGDPASSGWYSGNGGYFAYSLESTASAGSPSSTPSYADVTGYANASLSSVNSSSADRTITFYPVRYLYNPNTNGTTISYENPVSKRVRGLGSASSGPWDNTSGTLVKGIGNGWYFSIEQYYETSATTGASSTAIGLTFPGGTGGAASTTTYTNTAVTPGNSYSIVVPSGGSVTLQYYA